MASALVMAGMGIAAGSAGGAVAAPGDGVMAQANPAGPTVGSKVVTGEKKTGRYLPESFAYRMRVPTLKGVADKVSKAFDKRIQALIRSELSYYAKGAAIKANVDFLADEWSATSTRDDVVAFCQSNFKNLKGKFTSSVYKGRYVSAILTFSGQNAACAQLGGLWGGYHTNRSVTIDTRTGALMKITDFTSNLDGKVSSAVKAWYDSVPHGYLRESMNVDDTVVFHAPTVTPTLDVCDRPGNVLTDSPKQEGCFYTRLTRNVGLLSWRVSDKGLHMTFNGGDGLRHALLPWSAIPRLA
jgi:hypothetical protein